MSFLLNQEFFLISSYYITGKIIDFFFVPVLGEDGTHLAAQCPVNLAERPRGRDLLETWSRDREVETFWRLGRETKTVEDSTETAEGHGCLVCGRSSL